MHLRQRLLPALLAVLLVGVSSGEAQPPGGLRPIPTTGQGVIKAAKFAVQARSKEEQVVLVRIVRAQSQVVAGTNYRMRLQVRVGGITREADAVVWAKLDRTYELTEWKYADGGAKPAPKKDDR